jgi:CRP/FNR family transcriptional regulator, cyclic AMP receptor protein
VAVTTVADNEYYELLAHGRTPSSFAAGQVIFNKGDEAEGLYVVREGSVTLRDGDRLIETIAAPSLFGEMALIESEPRSLTAEAVTDTVLVHIPTRHFWILVHETPYFASLVMTVMAQRLRRANNTS